MVSAFLLLVPLAPLAAFRATAPVPAALFADAQEPSTMESTAAPSCPSGAPGSPDTGGLSSPLSPRAVRQASRAWEWKNLETPGWKILSADRAVLRGDVSVDSLRTAGAYLEAFFRMLQEALGGDASGIMFSARVFADPRDFRRYAVCAGAPQAESFYDPRTAELVVCWDGSRDLPWLQKTLAHEFTHAYMDRVWGRTEPLWFAEGMAEYFSNFAVREGRLGPGALDRRALLLLRLDDPVPLRRFVRLGRDEMYGATFPLLYAQAWSFVHYLCSRQDGVVDLLLRGRTPENLDELEKGWKEHLDKLFP